MQDDSWQAQRLVAVDTETTGLAPDRDRIIEVAAVEFADGEVVDRWSTLVDPEMELPAETVRITGIRQEDVDVAPKFAAVAQELLGRLQDRIAVAYNYAFDKSFLEAELKRVGLQWPCERWIDPLIFVRELHRDQGSKKLEATAARLGIELTEAHRAQADAEVAGRVLFALAEQLPPRLSELMALQEQWRAQQQSELSMWRGAAADEPTETGQATPRVAAEGMFSLGPAYVYGSETDPVRAMFQMLPDGRATRR